MTLKSSEEKMGFSIDYAGTIVYSHRKKIKLNPFFIE